jgi:hypothetical protein
MDRKGQDFGTHSRGVRILVSKLSIKTPFNLNICGQGFEPLFSHRFDLKKAQVLRLFDINLASQLAYIFLSKMIFLILKFFLS